MGRGERKVARVRQLPLKPELPFLFTNPPGLTPRFACFRFLIRALPTHLSFFKCMVSKCSGVWPHVPKHTNNSMASLSTNWWARITVIRYLSVFYQLSMSGQRWVNASLFLSVGDKTHRCELGFCSLAGRLSPPSPCLDLGAINMGELLRAPQPTNALPPPPTYQLAPLKVLLKVYRIFLLIRPGTAWCAVCAVSVLSNQTRPSVMEVSP